MESATAAGCFYRAIPFAWYFSNSSNAFTHRSPPAYFSLTDGILCDPLPKRVDDVCANAQKLACWRNQPRAFAWAARNARNRAAQATQVQNAPASHDSFACQHSRGMRKGFQPGIEIGFRMRRRGHGATSFAFCAARNCGVRIVPSVSKPLREAQPTRVVVQRMRDPHLTPWSEPAETEEKGKEASTAGEGWRPTTRPRAGQ